MTRPAPLLLVLVAAAIALGPRPSRAGEPASSDSSLHRFLDTLADSTDRYFGLIAAPLDTAGLDSALVAGLGRPWFGPRGVSRFSLRPVHAFNRVDGTLWAGSVGLRDPGAGWRVRADLGYAAGSDAWLGGGELSVATRRDDPKWTLRVTGGRRTETVSRDRPQRQFASIRALLLGSDRLNYLRRDGVTVGISGEGPGWGAGLEFRDQLESPLTVTTRWNLARRTLSEEDNLRAAFGRVRELGFGASLRIPGSPFQARLAHQISDRALGSDFDYRRTHVALGGEIVAGGRVSILPQLAYGRLGGDPVPQAAFYLGGPRSLRSLHSDSLGGTGKLIARLEAIGADDLLALAHIPHPAMFPIQGAVFAAIGTAWGVDPFGGPGTPDGAWPEREAWISEAGVSLLYRPGMPEEDAYLRVNLAWPIGPHGGKSRWSVSYSRAMDLVRPY